MKELRTLALAATPGPWKSFVETLDHGGWKPETQQVTIGAEGVLIATYDTSYAEYPDDERNASNAAFIAAVSPDVVLGLLDRIEALEDSFREILMVHANDNHRPKAFYIADKALGGRSA
jgi:hypothetical protein